MNKKRAFLCLSELLIVFMFTGVISITIAGAAATLALKAVLSLVAVAAALALPILAFRRDRKYSSRVRLLTGG